VKKNKKKKKEGVMPYYNYDYLNEKGNENKDINGEFKFKSNKLYGSSTMKFK
jgi:hypothetical protein